MLILHVMYFMVMLVTHKQTHVQRGQTCSVGVERVVVNFRKILSYFVKIWIKSHSALTVLKSQIYSTGSHTLKANEAAKQIVVPRVLFSLGRQQSQKEWLWGRVEAEQNKFLTSPFRKSLHSSGGFFVCLFFIFIPLCFKELSTVPRENRLADSYIPIIYIGSL